MVFKRYIKRHGKKLGPYYYENIRSKDGKVKSVYVGTNPSHHPKHRIRKPLFFIILALLLVLVLGGSLFFFQNKSYIVQKGAAEEPDFEVDQILIKVLVREKEFIEKQLRVMSTGSGPSSISVDAYEISDLVSIGSKSFDIKPGQTKVVGLNFSSFTAQENIEQQPGIYIGKLAIRSEKAAKEIPVVVEIETKNVLFDINLNPVAFERKVKQGTDTTIDVRLFNLESIESQNVDVEYFVKDMNGNTIVTESETVVVKTQASFFKTISIPKNLKPGAYIFAAQSKFGNSIGTASYLFEVVGPEPEGSFIKFCKNNVLCLGLSLATILLIFALLAYFYFFIGAYIFEKISGIAALPRQKEMPLQEKIEVGKKTEEPTFLENLRAKIKTWRKERERRKKEGEIEERHWQLQRLAEERKIQVQLKKKQAEIEKKAQEGLARKQEIRKLEEEERSAQLRKLKEIEEKKREEELRKEEEKRNKKQLERVEKVKEIKKQAKEFFHNVGLYKTAEEKRQLELQKRRDDEKRKKIKEELR
ncbi:hypothetical protein HYT92_02895 [Candidatus Pacearchaeota archaeon]|nr:hypothetical protein [Candidatus Pacearchaeota archaeon]